MWLYGSTAFSGLNRLASQIHGTIRYSFRVHLFVLTSFGLRLYEVLESHACLQFACEISVDPRAIQLSDLSRRYLGNVGTLTLSSFDQYVELSC